MKINQNQLKIKEPAGKTKSGDPVLYVETHGGLHLFFMKREGKLVSLAAAPHKAIAQWLAEKQENIEWKKDFLQKSEDFQEKLEKSRIGLYHKLRQLLWGQEIPEPISDNKDQFLLFSNQNKDFQFFKKEELIESIKKKEISKYDAVRELDLSDSFTLLLFHNEFRNYF